MMTKIDLTVCVTPQMVTDAQGNEKKAFAGHIGTHFDVMNKTFPLDYTEREAVVFDISANGQGETQVADIDLSLVGEGMFVAFHSGCIDRMGYGGKEYFTQHPQLSMPLIQSLIDRRIAIIGVDFAGVRRGKEHTPTDQVCADHGIFIVENLCNLSAVLKGSSHARFKAYTFPVNFSGITGLPCRVVAGV